MQDAVSAFHSFASFITQNTSLLFSIESLLSSQYDIYYLKALKMFQPFQFPSPPQAAAIQEEEEKVPACRGQAPGLQLRPLHAEAALRVQAGGDRQSAASVVPWGAGPCGELYRQLYRQLQLPRQLP